MLCALFRDSNGDLVSVQLHHVSAEGTPRLLYTLGYDISAVVDYPPLAVTTDNAVVSGSLDEVVLCEDGAVCIVVGVFCPFEITQVVR